MTVLSDIDTIVWRLEGFWKVQDFGKYEQNRKYITDTLSEYDKAELHQMISFIGNEISDSANKIMKLQAYQKNMRALRTIMEKEIERRVLSKNLTRTLSVAPQQSKDHIVE